MCPIIYVILSRNTYIKYIATKQEAKNTSAKKNLFPLTGTMVTMLSSHKSWSPWTLCALDLILLAPHLKITTRPCQIQFQAVLWRPVEASLDEPYPKIGQCKSIGPKSISVQNTPKQNIG